MYVTLGLKQGEPLAPLLFILFINDVTRCIHLCNITDSDLNQLSMYLLLFPDDITVITTDPVIVVYKLSWIERLNY